MSMLENLREFFFMDSPTLQTGREATLVGFSVAASALMVLLLGVNLYQGRHLAALVNALLILVLIPVALALRRGRPAPRPFKYVLLPTMLGIALGLDSGSIQGALWSFPALLLCHFAMRRRAAFYCSLTLWTLTGLLTGLNFGADTAVRVCATLLLCWVMINSALNALARMHDELAHQASTDPLTGALNRRQLDLALGELVKRVRRRPVPASIMLIDVDNFKQINDRLGHAVGDQVLTGLVKLLAERKRTADSLYRLGGEEFLLLAPDTVGPDASVLAEQLRALIEKAELIKGLRVEVSIGVSECRSDQSPEEWLEFADQALYRAKEKGRNRVENSVFSDSAFNSTASPHAAASGGGH